MPGEQLFSMTGPIACTLNGDQSTGSGLKVLAPFKILSVCCLPSFCIHVVMRCGVKCCYAASLIIKF